MVGECKEKFQRSDHKMKTNIQTELNHFKRMQIRERTLFLWGHDQLKTAFAYVTLSFDNIFEFQHERISIWTRGIRQ